jgi:deazaflavin-dependent oxidoreductase (nitroreductase family)
MTTAAQEPARQTRPLLGLRRQPGRLALAAMRLPRPLYHRGWGRLLGHTFLLLTHRGRKTGKPRETVAMALSWDPARREAVICSAWGETEWVRNLRARPALKIQIGKDSFIPEQRFLSEDESTAVGIEFRRRHPWRLRLLASILGWGHLNSEQAMREFVRRRPFVSFQAAHRELDELAQALEDAYEVRNAQASPDLDGARRCDP